MKQATTILTRAASVRSFLIVSNAEFNYFDASSKEKFTASAVSYFIFKFRNQTNAQNHLNIEGKLLICALIQQPWVLLKVYWPTLKAIYLAIEPK